MSQKSNKPIQLKRLHRRRVGFLILSLAIPCLSCSLSGSNAASTPDLIELVFQQHVDARLRKILFNDSYSLMAVATATDSADPADDFTIYNVKKGVQIAGPSSTRQTSNLNSRFAVSVGDSDPYSFAISDRGVIYAPPRLHRGSRVFRLAMSSRQVDKRVTLLEDWLELRNVLGDTIATPDLVVRGSNDVFVVARHGEPCASVYRFPASAATKTLSSLFDLCGKPGNESTKRRIRKIGASPDKSLLAVSYVDPLSAYQSFIELYSTTDGRSISRFAVGGDIMELDFLGNSLAWKTGRPRMAISADVERWDAISPSAAILSFIKLSEPTPQTVFNRVIADNAWFYPMFLVCLRRGTSIDAAIPFIEKNSARTAKDHRLSPPIAVSKTQKIVSGTNEGFIVAYQISPLVCTG